MEQKEIKTNENKELYDGEQQLSLSRKESVQYDIMSDSENLQQMNLRRKQSTRKESIISLENEVKNLRFHIEEDDRLIDDKIKEMSNHEILGERAIIYFLLIIN